MKLVIKNGKVISWFRDNQEASGPEGSEIIDWSGAIPQPVYAQVGGVEVIVDLPPDPRTEADKLQNAKEKKLKELEAWDADVRKAGTKFGSLQMRFDEYGQRRLATLLIAVLELSNQSKVSPSTELDVWDATGVDHKITVADFRSGISEFFTESQKQEKLVGDTMKAIYSASDIKELEAIKIGKQNELPDLRKQ